MNKNSKGIIHLLPLLVIALILIFGAGYWVYNRIVIGMDCQVLPSKKFWFLYNPTADWKKYSNEKYGIELSYPSDLTLGQISEESLTIFRKFSPDEKKDDKNIRVNFYAYSNSQNLTSEDFFKKRFCTENKSSELEINKCIEHFEDTKKCVKVGDINSTKAEHLQYGNISQVVLVPYYDFIYVFSLHGNEESGAYTKTAENTFKKLLSTINFTGLPQLEVAELLEQAKTEDLWSPICSYKNLENFEIRVRKGDSATSIARQVLDSYLTALTIANIPNKVEVSSEERVYAEDYIRKKQELVNLEVGSSVQIPCQIVEEASIKSRLLTISQKQNLKDYSKNVTKYQILDLINEIIEESTPEGELKPQIFTLP